MILLAASQNDWDVTTVMFLLLLFDPAVAAVPDDVGGVSSAMVGGLKISLVCWFWFLCRFALLYDVICRIVQLVGCD